MMHLEEFVGAIAKEFRVSRPKVGESVDELLGSRSSCLMEMDFWSLDDHAYFCSPRL